MLLLSFGFVAALAALGFCGVCALGAASHRLPVPLVAPLLQCSAMGMSVVGAFLAFRYADAIVFGLILGGFVALWFWNRSIHRIFNARRENARQRPSARPGQFVPRPRFVRCCLTEDDGVVFEHQLCQN